MGNRPTIVVDPDGRIWHVLIGGAIGGVLNIAGMAMNGNIHTWGDAGKAFIIGFVAGVVATATGGAALGVATGVGAGAGITGGVAVGAGGVMAGVGAGAVSGGAGGFIQGTGNAMVFGHMGRDEALTQGAKEGITGMIFGGITGGATNGILAKIEGRNIWNGNLKLYDIDPVPTNPTPTLKTYTYDENLARPDIDPIWRTAPGPRGNQIESAYAKTVYAGYKNTPYAQTVDFSDGMSSISLKSTMSEYLNIRKNILELSEVSTPFKKLHIVTPPGHIPANYTEILKLASQNNIMVELSHY